MAKTQVSLEMTITLAEFRSRLPEAVGGAFEESGHHFHGRDGSRTWQLRILPLPGRRLGALSLDRLNVELEFDGYTAAEVEAFLARFRLHYHRGGG